MWQFMPHGNYGLARNAYVDERFDPEKSTRAYARYMKFIYDQLGDWYLSMAGYDWGAGNVQRAVQKTGYADFWELYKRNNLPGETKNYVPEILAAIIIANHPTQYGFDDVTLDPPVLTDTVTINYSVDLRLVSDLVNAPVDELMALNPSLLRIITPPDAAFDLHLPAGTATVFSSASRQSPRPSAMHGATIAWRPRIRWPRWRASIAFRWQSWPRPINCARARAYRAWKHWWCRCRRRQRRSAHAALHRAQGRYAGHHRGSLRRLAQPIAPLEQDHGHQGGAGPAPARSRAGNRGAHIAQSSPSGAGCGHKERRARVSKERRHKAGSTRNGERSWCDHGEEPRNTQCEIRWWRCENRIAGKKKARAHKGSASAKPTTSKQK